MEGPNRVTGKRLNEMPLQAGTRAEWLAARIAWGCDSMHMLML